MLDCEFGLAAVKDSTSIRQTSMQMPQWMQAELVLSTYRDKGSASLRVQVAISSWFSGTITNR